MNSSPVLYKIRKWLKSSSCFCVGARVISSTVCPLILSPRCLCCKREGCHLPVMSCAWLCLLFKGMFPGNGGVSLTAIGHIHGQNHWLSWLQFISPVVQLPAAPWVHFLVAREGWKGRGGGWEWVLPPKQKPDMLQPQMRLWRLPLSLSNLWFHDFHLSHSKNLAYRISDLVS